jgi:hypothetical protein
LITLAEPPEEEIKPSRRQEEGACNELEQLGVEIPSLVSQKSKSL